MHTADLKECIFQCNLFDSFGACNWLAFYYSGRDENCHLFRDGSVTDWLSSCAVIGQPTILDKCPDDGPCSRFARTACARTSNAEGATTQSEYEECLAHCKEQDGIDFMTHVTHDNTCNCYANFTQQCGVTLAAVNASIEEFDECKSAER